MSGREYRIVGELTNKIILCTTLFGLVYIRFDGKHLDYVADTIEHTFVGIDILIMVIAHLSDGATILINKIKIIERMMLRIIYNLKLWLYQF